MCSLTGGGERPSMFYGTFMTWDSWVGIFCVSKVTTLPWGSLLWGTPLSSGWWGSSRPEGGNMAVKYQPTACLNQLVWKDAKQGRTSRWLAHIWCKMELTLILAKARLELKYWSLAGQKVAKVITTHPKKAIKQVCVPLSQRKLQSCSCSNWERILALGTLGLLWDDFSFCISSPCGLRRCRTWTTCDIPSSLGLLIQRPIARMGFSLTGDPNGHLSKCVASLKTARSNGLFVQDGYRNPHQPQTHS